jgi:hypothetical protein
MLAHVGEREFDLPEFRNAQDVGEQLFCETDATRANDSDFETHDPNLDAIKMPALEDEKKNSVRACALRQKRPEIRLILLPAIPRCWRCSLS